MEKQEGRSDEDGMNKGDKRVERDEGGATTVVVQDFPEGRSDEDGTNKGDKRVERDEEGATTVAVQDFPELQEGSLQQEQPDGEGAGPACPSTRQLPGWLRGSSARSAPRGKAQDEIQLEVGPMDEETTLGQRSQSLR